MYSVQSVLSRVLTTAMPLVSDLTGLNVPFPYHSHPLKFGPLLVSGWIAWWLMHIPLIGTAMLLDEFHVVESFAPGSITSFSIEFAIATLITIFIGARPDRGQYATVYADRLEMGRQGKPILTIRWESIVKNPKKKYDLIYENLGKGSKHPRFAYCFLYTEDGRQFAVELLQYFYPESKDGPAWKNANQLSYAFLVSLLKARPDLRIHSSVYKQCAVHPYSLEYNSVRKYVDYAATGLVMCLLLLGLVYFFFVWDQHLKLPFLAQGAVILAAMLVSGSVAFGFVSWLTDQFFAQPEAPAVREHRIRLIDLEKSREQGIQALAVLNERRHQLRAPSRGARSPRETP